MEATEKHVRALRSNSPLWDRWRQSYKIRSVALGGANLEGANLEGANLGWTDLEEANLEEANLEGANLGWTDLDEADLRGANLEGANLEGANLEGANLEGANLRRANLEGVNGVIIFNKRGGRVCYAIDSGGGLMIQAGCFWGTLDQFEQNAKTHYGGDTAKNYSVQIKYLRSV